ncbi:MAG: hypothetical protein PVF76_05230 [Syntrophobacterales bacterium]
MDHLSTQNSRKTKVSRGSYNRSGSSSLSLSALLLSVAVLLVHCTPLTQRQETVPNRPETRVYQSRLDIIREAVKRVLDKKKFFLDEEQSNSLYIQSEWLEEGRYRSMVKAALKPLERSRTEVRLHILVEKKGMFKEAWEPEDEIGIDVYRSFLDDVEMEGYRVLYDGA